MPTSPALAAAYQAAVPPTRVPATEQTLTIAPPPLSIKRGIAASLMRKAEERLCSMPRSHISNLVPSAKVEGCPALFTSAWKPPKRSRAASPTRRLAARSAASASSASASPPAAEISAAVPSTAPRSMSVITTRAPSAANLSAVARPIPAPAPVTIATLFCRRIAAPSSVLAPWGTRMTGHPTRHTYPASRFRLQAGRVGLESQVKALRRVESGSGDVRPSAASENRRSADLEINGYGLQGGVAQDRLVLYGVAIGPVRIAAG